MKYELRDRMSERWFLRVLRVGWSCGKFGTEMPKSVHQASILCVEQGFSVGFLSSH